MKSLKAVQVSSSVNWELWDCRPIVKIQNNLISKPHIKKDTEILEKTARRLVAEGRTRDALKKYYEIMRIFDAEMVPPFQDYCKCQQAIKECLLEYGNKIQID